MKADVPIKIKLRFVAHDDYSKCQVSETGSAYLLDLTLKKTKTWNNVIEYFEQKWQFIANLKQRIRIFFIDVKGRQSVDMVSTFPLISVGETLSLHPSVLAYQNCSSSPKDKGPLVTESNVLIIQMFYSLRNKDVMQSTIDLTLTTSIRGGAHSLKSEIASRGTKVKKHSSPKSKIYPANPYETFPVGRPRTAVSKLHDENQNFDLAISSMQNFSHRSKVKGGKSIPKFDSSMTPVALQHFNKAPIQIFSSEFSQSLWNQGDSDSFAHAHGNENGHGGTLDFSTGTTGHDLETFGANHDKPASHADSSINQPVAQPYTCMNSIFSPTRSSTTEMGCCDINDCTQDIIDGIANGLIHITSSSSNAPLCQSPSSTSTRAIFDRIILREEEQQQLPVLTDCVFHRDTADDVITLAPAPPLMPEISPVSLQPHAMPLDSSDAFTYNISACELPSNSLVMCDGGGISGSRDVSLFNVSDPFHDIDFPFSEVKERKDYQDPLFFFSNIGNGFSFRNGNNDSPQGDQRDSAQGDQRIGVDRSDLGFSNDLDILMGGHNYPELPSVENICMSGGILCSVNSTTYSEPSLNAIACEKARQDSLATTPSSFPSSSSTMSVTLPSCQPLLDSFIPVLECAPQGHIDCHTAQLGALAAPAHTVVKKAGLSLKIRISASENENSVPIPIPVPAPAIIPISISVPFPVPVPVPVPFSVPTPTLPSIPVYVPVSIPVPTPSSVPIFANDPRGATVKTAEIFDAVGSAGAGAVNGMVFSPSSSMLKPSVVVPLAGITCAPTAGSVTAAAIAADSEKSETPREVMQKISAVRLFGYIEQIDEIRYRDDCERRSPVLCGTITKERTDSVSVSTKSLSPSYKSNQVNEVRNCATETAVVDDMKQHVQHVQHVQEVNAAIKGIKISDANSVAADNLFNSSKGIPYLDQQHRVDHCEKERNKDSLSGLSTSRRDGNGCRSSTPTPRPAILTSPLPISLPHPPSSTSSSSSSSPPHCLLSSDMLIGRTSIEEVPVRMCESSVKKMRVKSVGGPSSSYPTMDTLDLVHDSVPPTALRKKRDREDEDKNGNQDENEDNDERELGMCNRTPGNVVIISPGHNAGSKMITVAAIHVETDTGTGTGTGTGEEENERSRVADSLTRVNSPAGLTPSLSKPSPPPVSSCSYLFPHQTFQDSSSDSNSSNGAAGSSDGSNAADSVKNVRIPENFRLFYTEINDIIMISSRIKCLSKKDGKGRKRLTPTFLVPLSMKDKYVEHLVFMNTFQ